MKKIKTITLTVIYITLLISILTLVDCFSGPTETTYDIREQTDPYYCLWNLRTTYNRHKDIGMIDHYKNILEPIEYKFYFDPDDVGKWTSNGYQIPFSWNYDEDWQATQNMFNKVHSIDLTIPTLGEKGDDTDKANFYARENPQFNPEHTTCIIDEVNINLLVMFDATNGMQAIGPCTFHFKLCDDNMWRITAWYDQTAPE
ncbi:MAG: hypothetical protein ACUVWP_04960 [bacterium]